MVVDMLEFAAMGSVMSRSACRSYIQTAHSRLEASLRIFLQHENFKVHNSTGSATCDRLFGDGASRLPMRLSLVAPSCQAQAFSE